MVTFSKCTEKGFYFGALTFTLGLLIGDNLKYRLIGAVSNMTGVTVGNYIIKNSRFFDDWEENTKGIAIFALGFFTSCAFWSIGGMMNEKIQFSRKITEEAGGWLLTYLFFSNLVIV